MASPNNIPLSELSLRQRPSSASPNSDTKQAKYDAAVLARKADSEGWSEEKLTMALKAPSTRAQSSGLPPAPTPSTARPEDQNQATKSDQDMILEKRQETVRIMRQAEMEGWSDEKLVAALRIRLEIGHELRARAKTL